MKTCTFAPNIDAVASLVMTLRTDLEAFREDNTALRYAPCGWCPDAFCAVHEAPIEPGRCTRCSIVRLPV